LRLSQIKDARLSTAGVGGQEQYYGSSSGSVQNHYYQGSDSQQYGQ